MTEPIQSRQSLLDALQIDLIGPSGARGDHREVLPQAPSRWYLTGFLVPIYADEEQRFDPNSDDEVDQAPAVAGVDENEEPEKSAARRSYVSFRQACVKCGWQLHRGKVGDVAGDWPVRGPRPARWRRAVGPPNGGNKWDWNQRCEHRTGGKMGQPNQ